MKIVVCSRSSSALEHDASCEDQERQVVQGLECMDIGVVLLDCIIYLQHVMFHAVPALWRLHRMHHADLDFDVTAGLRFHPVEIMMSGGFCLPRESQRSPRLAFSPVSENS